jgi:hypothetical protein
VPEESKDSDMAPLDRSTNPDVAGVRSWRVSPTGSGAGTTIFAMIMLQVLAVLLVVAVWLFWTLASGSMSSQGAVSIVVGLAVVAAAFSWRTRWSLASSLIMVGSGGFILLLAALFGMAGYRLIFGG